MITVLRDGVPQPIDFDVTREVISVASVRDRILDTGYGYIRIAQFHTETGPEVGKAIDRMREEGPLLGLVLDLRFNPGGLLTSAHQISAVIDEVKEGCLGVFGGGHGRWMLSEMRRGASGFMPAAEAIDVHVQIWDAFQAGDERKARDIFNLYSK